MLILLVVMFSTLLVIMRTKMNIETNAEDLILQKAIYSEVVSKDTKITGVQEFRTKVFTILSNLRSLETRLYHDFISMRAVFYVETYKNSDILDNVSTKQALIYP